MVSYLHPLHTEDTSTCSQGMVRMTRQRPRADSKAVKRSTRHPASRFGRHRVDPRQSAVPGAVTA